jgi:hypothetical protein
MTNPTSDLEQTVERVRSEKFPSLPSAVVLGILQIEQKSTESRTEAVRLIDATIQSFLDSQEA